MMPDLFDLTRETAAVIGGTGVQLTREPNCEIIDE